MKPRFVPHPTSAYSTSASCPSDGQWIHIAGQLGIAEDGTKLSREDEARNAFAAIERELEAVGATLQHVVKLTTYVTDFADYDRVTAARVDAFGDHLPVSTAVCVSGLLFDAAIEIEAIAFIPNEQHDRR